ncbi:S8 family serine peptidase [Neolewinella aurantiaca]|uniref:S8 family serine peptidase n=1 Tax=Neolewinella aurantiaca TaxID=2602767 RepID=A0A5C7FZM3_9BACT|nr:S8 family serine peptidase [Neolewinella aurantiaca]TXF90758.1 S8 family serine peptidase [Neolewinella aurantiaca]
MLRFLLLAAACLLWTSTSFAQSQHYFVDQQKVNLAPTTTQFIVTADESITLQSVKADDIKKYESWPYKPYAVLETTRAMTTDEVVASLGFDTDEVQVSTAFSLDDGFVIYPTRNIAFKTGDKNDIVAIQQILGQYGIKSIEKKYGTYRVELNELAQVFDASNALYTSGLVEFSHPDFYAPIQRFQINDPLFGEQFQMHNTGQTIDGVSGGNDIDCNALEAWGLTLGSSSITVAVIDDGLEDHEDLETASGVSRYTNGFSPVNNGNGDAVSGSAHGVSCAGSIAASHNNIGVRGVAPLVNLISVNIFVGGESNQDLADAISWAKNNGADVMSNSWGFGSCTYSISVLNNALADANSNGRGGLGCVITFASGNDYQSCVSYPGDNVNVIGVGAIANTGARSAYSNYGPALDIVAPSNNVGGPGAGVRTTDRMGSNGYNGTNYTNTFGGTSSATPVVSGVAALVLGFNPNLTSSEVKSILYSTATDMGASGYDTQFGNGRVNALAAIQAAGGTGGPTCSDGIQNGQETGVDCGGPTCPSCPPVGCNGTDVTLSITLDNYPEETSWTLTNDAGVTVESGGTYGSQADGSTVTIDLCLVDDCYTFTILDAYGDGICCSYGSGSYTLSQGSTVLASGGSFGSSEATDFCIGGSPADTAPPSTPTGVSVSNEAETSVLLSWNASSDNVGVTGYNIFVDGASAGSVSGTSATINGLTACTTYSFSVSAFDAAGNTSGTGSATGTTTGCSSGGGDPIDIDGAYFESGLDGWTDGGSDCFRYSGTRSYEGTRSMRLRDNSGVASSMTKGFNLSGLNNVEISFIFYPNSMENGEDFWVRYNSGSGWQTVATYAAGSSFSNGSFYSATIVLDAAQYSLNANSQFRIQCDASANGDQVYIDAVTVRGNVATTTSPGQLDLQQLPTVTLFDEGPESEQEVRIAPNPADDIIMVSADEPILEVSVLTIDGKQLMVRTFEGVEQATLRVDDLPTGLYLISVLTNEERNAERVVIRR